MSSYFTLTLDTTPPLVEIYAPTYTIRGINNNIEVVANEELSLYQDIYIIDSLGNKHDLIFSYEIDRFLGIINFEEYPLGGSVLYARLKDTVSNESVLASKPIEIISDIFAFKLSIEMNNSAMGLYTSDISRLISMSDTSSGVSIEDSSREVIISNE